MVVTGTREAFAALINRRGIYKKLGVSISTVAGWKIYLSEGKSISLDKMEEMLLRAGGTVVQEKVWEVNSILGNDTFTAAEIESIKTLIAKIRSSGEVLQKKYRRQLREDFNFRMEDFEQGNGFTVDDLQKAIVEGDIKVSK